MATKFYFHRGTTTDTGTLPAAGASVSATTPTQIATGGDTNRSMDETISAIAQTSNALTTLANTSAQPSLILRFLSAALAAQTIAAQQLTGAFGYSESSTNSTLNVAMSIALWRPGTGAVVGRLFDNPAVAWNGTTSGSTTEQWDSRSNASTSQTAQDGDILVCEIWRNTSAQGMATAYTNTVFYDGTTEGSATNAAAFISFPNTITFLAAASAVRSGPVIVSQAVQRAATR